MSKSGAAPVDIESDWCTGVPQNNVSANLLAFGSVYSMLMTLGLDGQAVGCNPTFKQVRLLPASLTDSGVAQAVRASR